MAVDIGPRIGIEGEAEYRRQLNQIITQTKTLHAEMRSMETAWNKDTSAKQKATQKTELLNKQIDAQNKRIEELNRGLAECSAKYGENDIRTQKWKQAVANAETELHQMEAELRRIPNSLQIVGQQMQSVGDKMTKVGSTMTKTITAPIVAVGAAAVKTASDFDTSMSKVRALSGATGDDYDRLRDKAREMGATTKYSAQESADALGYMALAGWNTDQMIDGLDGVLNLAAASGMELAEASDLVTDYLSAFGLEAKDSAKMADELAYAQAHSNTTTTQLGEAFGNSAAQMHTAGQSMETTTAILEAFANQGLKGSEAGTALSAMMRDITQKMENGRIQIGDTTVAVQDQNGNFRNMIDILADVEAATEGMGSAEKSAALMTTFTARSVKGVSMALTEGSDSIRQYEQELYGASGTAKEMAEVMQDNLAGQITKLKSALQELGISLGDTLVPMTRKAVEWLQGMVDKFNALDDTTKENIVKLGLVAAAIGPVLTVTGKATSGIGKLVEGFGNLAKGMGGVPFTPVALAITGVATAIGLVIAANEMQEKAYREANEEVYAAIDASEKARESLKRTGEEIGTAFDTAEESISMATERAEMARSMVDRLEELVSKEKLSNSEMMEAKSIVSQLNAAYPGLNAEIDENGKLLNVSADGMREFIDNALEMATVEAKQQALKKAMEELTDAVTAKVEAQARAKQIDKELVKAEDEYRKAVEAAQKQLDDSGNTMKAQSEYGYQMIQINQEHAKKVNDLKKEQGDLTVAIDEQNDKIKDGTEYYNTLNESLDETITEMDGTTDATEDATTATGNYGDEVEDVITTLDEYGNSIDVATGEIVEYKDEATQSFMKAYESAKQSIEGQIGLFEQMSLSAAHSTEEIEAAFTSQTNTYNQMAEDMEVVWNYAVQTGDTATQNLVRQIANLGIQGSGDMNTLANAVRNGNTDIVTSMSQMATGVDGAKNRYANIMAQVQSNTVSTTNGMVWAYQGAMNSMTASTQTGMNNINAWVGNGMGTVERTVGAGMNNAMWAINNSGNGMGTAAQNAFSPVPVKATNAMVNTQHNVTDWMNNTIWGINNSGGGLSIASSNAFGVVPVQANAAMSGMYGIGTGGAYNMANGLYGGQWNVSNAAWSVANAANMPMSSVGSGAWSWGNGAANNLANGIWAAYSNVVNAAQSVANAVWSLWHHSTPEEGPLKDDDKWGSDMVGNLVKGMLHEIPAVRQAALQVADAATVSTDSYSYTLPESGAAQISQTLQGIASPADDITINVYASEGMNVNQLADQVQQRLALLQRQRTAAYA